MSFPHARLLFWLLIVVVVSAGIVAAIFAASNYYCSDMTPLFRFNAALGVVVFLALLAGMVAAGFWMARSFGRGKGLRFSVRGMMVAVAFVGVEMSTALWWVRYNFATVYASGFSESQFRRVRIGMTSMEVESILGPPLQKDSTSRRWSPYENWIYSEAPPTGTFGDNYWRRWVMFEHDKVAVIVDDYYVD